MHNLLSPAAVESLCRTSSLNSRSVQQDVIIPKQTCEKQVMWTLVYLSTDHPGDRIRYRFCGYEPADYVPLHTLLSHFIVLVWEKVQHCACCTTLATSNKEEQLLYLHMLGYFVIEI